jgi:hypothetical protein
VYVDIVGVMNRRFDFTPLLQSQELPQDGVVNHVGLPSPSRGAARTATAGIAAAISRNWNEHLELLYHNTTSCMLGHDAGVVACKAVPTNDNSLLTITTLREHIEGCYVGTAT